MKSRLAVLCALAVIWLGSAVAGEPVARLVDPRVIHATFAQRQAWVVDRLSLNPQFFDGQYGWILLSPSLGEREVHQLAYLFFYSSGEMCGVIERPVKTGDVWSCAFQLGLSSSYGFPVLVDPTTGFAWQEGQSEKIDLLSLIRFIEGKRKEAQPGATDNPDDAQRLREDH